MKTLIFLLALGVAPTPPVTAQPEAWRTVHDRLLGERDRMARDLDTAHAALLARARAANDTDAINRLRPEAPGARQHGYGLLPEIVAGGALESQPPRRSSYSLDALSTSYTSDIRDAATLAQKIAAEPGLPLGPRVDEFERLRDRLQNMEDHLDYHARWQVAVVEYRDYFARRNRIAGRVRRLVDLLEQGAPQEEIELLRGEVLEEISTFLPAAGLRIERGPAGRAVLPVEVVTDIRDASFLDAARRAIEHEYSATEAVRAARFSVRVKWRRVRPSELYPDRVPQPGAAIDLGRHLDRFPHTAGWR